MNRLFITTVLTDVVTAQIVSHVSVDEKLVGGKDRVDAQAVGPGWCAHTFTFRVLAAALSAVASRFSSFIPSGRSRPTATVCLPAARAGEARAAAAWQLLWGSLILHPFEHI